MFGIHVLDLFLPLLFLLVISGLLILGLLRLFTAKNRHFVYMPPTFTSGTALSQLAAIELLRLRYARGEIDTATFESMRERLENSGGPGPQ